MDSQIDQNFVHDYKATMSEIISYVVIQERQIRLLLHQTYEFTRTISHLYLKAFTGINTFPSLFLDGGMAVYHEVGLFKKSC